MHRMAIGGRAFTLNNLPRWSGSDKLMVEPLNEKALFVLGDLSPADGDPATLMFNKVLEDLRDLKPTIVKRGKLPATKRGIVY